MNSDPVTLKDFSEVLGSALFLAKASEEGKIEVEWLTRNPFADKDLFSVFGEKDADTLALEIVRASQTKEKSIWRGVSGKSSSGQELWHEFVLAGREMDVIGSVREITGEIHLQKRIKTLWEYSRITSRYLNGFTFVGEILPDGSRRFLYTSLTDINPENLEFSETAAFTENFLKRIHPDDRKSLDDSLAEGLNNATTWDWQGRFIFPSYGYRWMRGRGTFLPQKNGTVQVRALVQDVTELVETEQKTKEKDSLFQELMKNIPGLIYRCAMDRDWTVLFVSEGVEELTGYPPDDFLDNRARTFNSVIHPDDQEMVYETVLQGVQENRAYTVSYRILHKNGAVKWVSEKGRALYDEEGVPVYLNGAIFDTTEMRKLEDALFHAQKMESLGVMAGGVAHDFNNLLVSIMGFNELAKVTLADPLRSGIYIDNAIKASRQAADLCKQMLAYAGRGQFKIKLVDLNTRILDISHLLKASLGKEISLYFDLSSGLSPIKADPSQMDQILMNFIINASEAMEGMAGNIFIKTEEKFLGRAQLTKNRTGTFLEEGSFVVLTVRDTGKGMSSETSRKIFDPFFTTKPTGRGLGLASVLGILKHHGAGVFLDSEPGIGSTFTVVFPAQTRAHDTRPQPSSPIQQSAPSKILIVDDDPRILEIAGAVLEQGNYEPILLQDGSRAAALAAEKGSEIKAALVDMNMPVLNGLEVLASLRKERPGLPVLLTSGYQQASDLGNWQDDPAVQFLPKPFTPAQLLETLRRLLALERSDT